MQETPHRPISKVLLQALIFWLGATVIGSASHIAAWTFQVDGLIRLMANAGYILALPGWVMLYAAGFSGIRDVPLSIIVANALAWAIWIGIFFIALRLRTRWVHRALQESIPSRPQVWQVPDPSRRAFMCNAAVGVTAVGAAAAPGYATLIEPWSIKIRRYTIPIRGLDPRFDALKIVQIADTHLGPRIPSAFVEQAYALATAEQPDLVFLTGDHVHDGTQDNQHAAELCKPLVEHATIAAVGVLGNHDWWGDGHHMTHALRAQGVYMIDNDRLWIDPETRTVTHQDPGAGSLALVGLGDLTDDYVDPTKAFREVAAHSATIVLAHNPDCAELNALIEPEAPKIDLMCSGHTHGGQVRIPLLGTPIVPSRFGSKYAGGLVQGPAFPVHISRGVGMSLLPVRVGVPPEISVMTLTRS